MTDTKEREILAHDGAACGMSTIIIAGEPQDATTAAATAATTVSAAAAAVAPIPLRAENSTSYAAHALPDAAVDDDDANDATALNSSCNKRFKRRVWMNFTGTRHTRVGDTFQVSRLPLPPPLSHGVGVSGGGGISDCDDDKNENRNEDDSKNAKATSVQTAAVDATNNS